MPKNHKNFDVRENIFVYEYQPLKFSTIGCLINFIAFDVSGLIASNHPAARNFTHEPDIIQLTLQFGDKTDFILILK